MLNIRSIFNRIKSEIAPILDSDWNWGIKLFAFLFAMGSTPLLMKAAASQVGFWVLLVPAYFLILSGAYDLSVKAVNTSLKWLFGVKKVKIDIFDRRKWEVNADAFFAANRASSYPYKTTLDELEQSLHEQLIHQHIQSPEERTAIVHFRAREIVDYMPSYFYGSDRRKVHTSQYDVSQQDIEAFRIRPRPRELRAASDRKEIEAFLNVKWMKPW